MGIGGVALGNTSVQQALLQMVQGTEGALGIVHVDLVGPRSGVTPKHQSMCVCGW